MEAVLWDSFGMDITGLKKEIDAELKKVKSEADCGAFHQKFLSKSGKVSLLLAGLRDVAAADRARLGAELNVIKRETEAALFARQQEIKEGELREKLLKDKLVDITVPSLGEVGSGSLHPITRVTREVEEIFRSMGFIVEDGPEIVTEFENFDSLNVPRNHPARDMQDTFWLDDGRLLSTQTSSLQNKMLKKYGPSFKAIFPGRCYRNENIDASHEMAFFQVEGMMVGEDISIANLIYFMKQTLAEVFKREIEVRLRPGFFPFVEPGFELDVACTFCNGKGCSVCKQGGWLELWPCGMIHPEVLRQGGVDPKKYQGFAFCIGLTRLAMLKYGIDDMRLFNSGNLEFLRGVK